MHKLNSYQLNKKNESYMLEINYVQNYVGNVILTMY